MDKRKSILNVSVSIISKIFTAIAVIVVRRILISSCGNEVNGLNSLYLSIVGFLAVTELGVGNAITFCMYKPIVEGDKNKVSALYHLFRKLYLIIGGVILACGLMITPFISYFAKDYAEINVNLYLTFVLMLISVVVTYLFSAKTALLNAYKNNYISTAITSAGMLFQYILQIAVLLITGSFVGYLVSRTIAASAQWLITDIVTRKKYSPILSNKQKVDNSTKKELVKNIKAMFAHKIGYLLVNTTDSLVISIFIGVVVLGKYSNYTTIMGTLSEILKLVFTSLTSVLGHLYVEENKETTKKYCESFHFLNFTIGAVFFLGYYAIIDNLISILFSADLIVSKSVTFVITLNGFVQFMRQSTLSFRDATGTFYNDRFKPLIEGPTNIILSVILVNFIGVTGVIAATVITNLIICHVIEPYVLYKNAFAASPKKYYIQNYSMIALFTLALIVLELCMRSVTNQWLELLVNGLISVGVFVVIFVIAVIFNKDLFEILVLKFKERRKK